MEIKVQSMRKLDTAQGGTLKAFADVVLDGVILIKGLRVVEGKQGLFVSMPQQQNKKDQKWYAIVSILDEGLFTEVRNAVMDAYEGTAQAPSRGKATTPATDPDGF